MPKSPEHRRAAGPRIPYDDKLLPKDKPRITFGAESTAILLSSGIATFVNISNGYVSISVWYDNGVHGHSNAALDAGEEWPVNVQTGDTYSWDPGNVGVPDGNPRYYMRYGVNDVG